MCLKQLTALMLKMLFSFQIEHKIENDKINMYCIVLCSIQAMKMNYEKWLFP